MKVLLIPSLASENWFSMNQYAIKLFSSLKGLETSEFEVKLLRGNQFRLAGTKEILVRNGGKFIDKYFVYPHEISKEKTDLIHILDHSYGYLLGFLKNILPKKIVTCHDPIDLVKEDILKDTTIRFPAISVPLYRLSVNQIRYADFIICVSKYVKKNLEYLDTFNIPTKIVDLGIDDIFFRGVNSKTKHEFLNKNRINPNKRYILHVGTNIPGKKNIEVILKSLSILRKEDPRYCLLKVGSEFNKEQKGLIKEFKLESGIKHLGQIPQEETRIVYEISSLLVQASSYEGFSWPVTEAMATGTPVIASDISPLTSITERSAYIVPTPLNEEELAKAIIKVSKSKKLAEKLVRKGKQISRKYTWDKAARNTLNIYRQVYKGK